MPKETWIIASLLTMLLLLGLLGLASWEKKQEVEKARTELAQAQAAGARTRAEAGRPEGQAGRERSPDRGITEGEGSGVQTRQNLEDEMRAGAGVAGRHDLPVARQADGEHPGPGAVRFRRGRLEAGGGSGPAEGRRHSRVAFNPEIDVIGHTGTCRSEPPPVAGFRAIGAFHCPRHGRRPVSSPRPPAWTRAGLGAVGYGEFRPVADNATPEGRARNRRIAITILSEELAGADTAPAAAPNSPALRDSAAPARPTPWLIPRPDSGARDSLA